MSYITNETPEENGCLQMDIMLLGDFSGSVEGYEPFVADAFKAFAKRFELSEDGVKIGAAIFNSDTLLISPLTSNEKFLHNQLDSLTYYYQAQSTTDMIGALQLAMHEFEVNGRVGYRKIIILVSDGKPDVRDTVIQLSQLIKASNIGICGILILANNNDREFMKVISSDYCFVESSYENLITELKRLDVCM